MPEFTNNLKFNKKKIIAKYSSSKKGSVIDIQRTEEEEKANKNNFFQLIQPSLPKFNLLYKYEKETFNNKIIQYYHKITDPIGTKNNFLELLDETLELFPIVKDRDTITLNNILTVNFDVKYIKGRQIFLLLKKTSVRKDYAIKLYQISFQNIINHIFCHEILKISKQKNLLFWSELAPYPKIPEIEMFGVANWLSYSVPFCIMEWIEGNSLEILQSKGVQYHMSQILKNLFELEIGADAFLKNWIIAYDGM